MSPYFSYFELYIPILYLEMVYKSIVLEELNYYNMCFQTEKNIQMDYYNYNINLK